MSTKRGQPQHGAEEVPFAYLRGNFKQRCEEAVQDSAALVPQNRDRHAPSRLKRLSDFERGTLI